MKLSVRLEKDFTGAHYACPVLEETGEIIEDVVASRLEAETGKPPSLTITVHLRKRPRSVAAKPGG